MPKPKKKAGFGSPTTENPIEEMSWCFGKNIRILIDPEALKGADGYWKQTGRYRLVVDNAGKRKESDWLYNKDNVVDAVNDLYREIYKRNNG
jgi:hypothetical protein